MRVRSIFKVVLPLTVISFGTVTKWWYALTVDAPDTMFVGFPLAYSCPGWHTSLSLQVFVSEFLLDFLTYFLFWLILTFYLDRTLAKIQTFRWITISLWSVSGLFIAIGTLFAANPDNIFYIKRPFEIQVLETGYEFVWQQPKRPDITKTMSDFMDLTKIGVPCQGFNPGKHHRCFSEHRKRVSILVDNSYFAAETYEDNSYKEVMRVFVAMTFLVHVSFLATAQRDSTGFWAVESGVTYATGHDISAVYGVGFKFSPSYSIPAIRKRILIIPHASLTVFGNYPDEATLDNLTLTTIGTMIATNHWRQKFLSIRAGLSYLYGWDDIAPRKGYTGDPITLLSFHGLSYNIGLKGRLSKHLYLLIESTFAKPKATTTSTMRDHTRKSFNTYSTLYNTYNFKSAKMSLGYVQFTVGYRFQIKSL